MGEAAKISLKAIGKQDTHLLSKDPEDSLFHPKIEQHSEFRKYHNRHTVSNPSNKSWWPFGETVKVDLNPQNMGDLLTNMWVRIDLPRFDTEFSLDESAERYYFVGYTAAEFGVRVSGSPFTIQQAYDYVRGSFNPFDEFDEVDQYYGFQYLQTLYRARSERFQSFLYQMIERNPYNVPAGVTVPESLFWGYAPYVGRKLIKKIRFIVDETVIEELDAESINIYDNIYKTRDQKIAGYLQYNMGIITSDYQVFNNVSLQRLVNSNQVFVHIPFFLSKNYRTEVHTGNTQQNSPFPVCAIHKQKIQIEIEFFDTPYFIHRTYRNGGVAPYDPSITYPQRPFITHIINNFDIVTEEITLNNEERLYYKNNPLTLTYDFMNRHTSTDVKPNEENTITVKLEPSIPVKIFHWFFRWKGYEVLGNYELDLVKNRFNYSEYPGGNHVLKTAHFTLNGERLPRISNIDYAYYSKYINSTMKIAEAGVRPNPKYSGGLADIYDKSYIYSYAFAINPKGDQMSGFLDFSDLNSERTKLHLELADEVVSANNDYTLYMYYIGYKTLKFENGYVSFVI